MKILAVDKLSETKCKRLGEGKHSDGRGLYLFVRGESKSWSLRYSDPGGRRREMSLASIQMFHLRWQGSDGMKLGLALYLDQTHKL